jgi:hypothetical protein
MVAEGVDLGVKRVAMMVARTAEEERLEDDLNFLEEGMEYNMGKLLSDMFTIGIEKLWVVEPTVSTSICTSR